MAETEDNAIYSARNGNKNLYIALLNGTGQQLILPYELLGNDLGVIY